MKYLPVWACLCCCAACVALARPATTRATTSPDTRTDAAEIVEMIPPVSHWPRVVLSVTAGLFVMAAIIGPVVLAQSRGNMALARPQDEIPRPKSKSS